MGKLKNKGLEIRDYQVEIAREVLESIESNNKYANVILLPWGTGKTIIGLLIAAQIERKPGEKILWVSGGAGGAERCKQSLEMAKKFGFQDIIGYLADLKSPKGFQMRRKIWEASDIAFIPVGTLSNEFVAGRIPPLERFKLVIVDEVSDLVARDLSGLRVSKTFEVFVKMVKERIPIVGLTATKDKRRLKFIEDLFNAQIVTRDDVIPFSYERRIVRVEDTLVEMIDSLLSRLIGETVKRISEILGKTLPVQNAMELLYGGILKRLQGTSTLSIQGSLVSPEMGEKLLRSFASLHKLAHMRLLILESTPGALLSYVKQETTLVTLNIEGMEDNSENVLFPKKINRKEFCDRCGEQIPEIEWRFDLFSKEEFEDYTRKPTRKSIWCVRCSRQNSKDVDSLIAKLDSKERSSGLYLSLHPEWRLILKVAEERWKRTGLSGKTVHAVSIIRNAVRKEGKKVVVLSRFRDLAVQTKVTLEGNNVPETSVLTGNVPLDTRQQIFYQFREGDLKVLVMTPLGAKGFDLPADLVVQMDITSSVDQMQQRRERIRGGEEAILVYKNTSEEKKLATMLSKEQDTLEMT